MRQNAAHSARWGRRMNGMVRGVAAGLLLALLGPSLTGAYETDLDLPVAPAVGGTAPDLFTGTLTARLPLATPFGRQGVQLPLALVYRGGNGNGPVGVGWKLDLGAIERSTRSGVDFTGDAYVFSLEGRLTELVADAGEYRAKVEGAFTRFQKLTAADTRPYWVATTRAGLRYFFGQTAAARQDDPANADRIFKWALDRIEDSFGNSLTVTYLAKDHGQLYPGTVRYAAHEGQGLPAHQLLTFYWEDRSDAPPLYTTGFQVTTVKRLRLLDAQSDFGNRLWTYQLDYGSGPTTG